MMQKPNAVICGLKCINKQKHTSSLRRKRKKKYEDYLNLQLLKDKFKFTFNYVDLRAPKSLICRTDSTEPQQKKTNEEN